MKSIVFTISCAIVLVAQTVHSQEQYTRAETPTWVTEHQLNTSIEIPSESISNGTFYRLVDDQYKVEENGDQAYYFRISQTVVNQKGLDSSSQIEIAFDPTYQSLVIHDINVIRGDTISDRYESADKSVFRSEDSFESRVYNGEVMFSAILDDIAVGDTIDYSYSIIGTNPVYQGLFSTSRTLVWSIPVQDQYHRVVWKKPHPLHSEMRNGEFTIEENILSSGVEYSVHVHMAEPSRFSSQAPDWNLPYTVVYYTETPTWHAVNTWALGLFELPNTSENIANIASSIREQTENKTEQLSLALDYVQETIRYVAIQLGENSHLPTPVDETLRLKYGDCKDKSLLLLAIMRELDIEGYPVLVNSSIGKALNELIPSVSRFDHVIVNAKVSDTSYWLDPTMTNQVGTLNNIYQPDFGYGLVVKKGQSALTAMNAVDITDFNIQEHYTIPESVEGAATLNVETTFKGWQAQKMQSRIQGNGLASITEQYLEFYQRSFPSAKNTSPLAVDINSEAGTVTIEENYEIADVFTEEDDGYTVYFAANDIITELGEPDVVNRNTPFVLNYPKSLGTQIIVEFEESGWEFDNEEVIEDNPFFQLVYNATYKNNTLTLDYEYEAKQDHVPADQIQVYLNARERALESTSYSIIKYKPDEGNSLQDTEEDLGSKILILVWLSLAFIVAILVACLDWVVYARKRNDANQMRFQPISFTKFYTLSVLTFGLYICYWIYRNWMLVEKHQNRGSWPIARAIFSVFWVFPLHKELVLYNQLSESPKRMFSAQLAALVAINYFVLCTINILFDQEILAIAVLFLLPLCFIPFIDFINRLYPKGSAPYSKGSKIGFRHIGTGLASLPLLLIYIGQTTALIPPAEVIEGERLWSHQTDFIYETVGLEVDDEIRYFYSDAALDFKADGNGFTDQVVFSYFEDNDAVSVDSATYSQIKKITSEKEDGMAVITVMLLDGTEFILYVSGEAGKDVEFLSALKAQWNAKKREKDE